MESVLQVRFLVPGSWVCQVDSQDQPSQGIDPPLYITVALTASDKVLLVVQGPDGGMCLL